MIEVQRLYKRFGSVTAVEDVSFAVRQGETFALLGPNGSGKTTTLKCLVGLIAPTSGEIRIAGVSRDRSRRLMSYLPQRVAFPEQVSALEVLEFYCKLRKLPLERIGPALERASFNGAATRLVSEFSGGMMQRLGLAVATLSDAPILVLDEPTVGLDPEGAIAFRQWLLSFKSAGKTIVFSSHLLEDVELLADRVAILVGGRLMAVEPVAALRPQAPAARLWVEDIYLRYVHANSDRTAPAAGTGGLPDRTAPAG